MSKKLLLLVILTIFLSSCSLPTNRKKNDDSGWKDEVLWAQECGMDGLPCCKNTDQPCQYGQSCCVSQTDERSDYCADTCEYGKEKTFCRKEDPKCDSGFVCAADKCEKCGDENESCCQTGEKCAADLICHNDKCLSCGLGGNPCCAVEPNCKNKVARDRSRTECMNGICTYCGSSNAIGCLSEPYCNKGHLLNNDFCLPCGGYNQPCCDEATEIGYECNPSEDLTCILGFCSYAK